MRKTDRAALSAGERPRALAGRRRQRGKFNLVTLLTLVAIVVAAYSAIRFTPIYIEKSRISRLVKRAANQWVNVTPSLEQVRKDLKNDFETSQVESVTAEDVQFARVTDNEVEAWVEYQVVVKHPKNIVKPTKLKFKIHHNATASVTN